MTNNKTLRKKRLDNCYLPVMGVPVEYWSPDLVTYGGVLVLISLFVGRKHAGLRGIVLINRLKKLVGNNTYAIAA